MKEFPCLIPGCKLNLVESLRSNLSVLLPTVDSLWRVSQQKDGNADEEKNDSEEDECSLADRVASYRNAFQIYTFFLIHIVLIEESKSSSNNITKVSSFLYLIMCVSERERDACSIFPSSAIL
uniref:Putative ovule protein n=1 Tax=Solanum chacoense TaxID=4108 RepID=A0A0V0HH10_SOLCH